MKPGWKSPHNFTGFLSRPPPPCSLQSFANVDIVQRMMRSLLVTGSCSCHFAISFHFTNDASFPRFPPSSRGHSAHPSLVQVHHFEFHRSPPPAACRLQISSNPVSPLICSSWTQTLHSVNNSNDIEVRFFGSFDCFPCFIAGPLFPPVTVAAALVWLASEFKSFKSVSWQLQ